MLLGLNWKCKFLLNDVKMLKNQGNNSISWKMCSNRWRNQRSRLSQFRPPGAEDRRRPSDQNLHRWTSQSPAMLTVLADRDRHASARNLKQSDEAPKMEYEYWCTKSMGFDELWLQRIWGNKVRILMRKNQIRRLIWVIKCELMRCSNQTVHINCLLNQG